METSRHEKLNELLVLAAELHGSADGHRSFTLQSMKDHVDEIRMLEEQGNEHWKAETVDLFIHCLLLLKNSGVDAAQLEQLIDRRLGRFREKITAALKDKQYKDKFRESVYGKRDPRC